MRNNDSANRKHPYGAARPFPWRCRHCGQHEVFPKTIPYTIEVRRDGHLHSLTVPALEIPVCRNCGEKVFTERVDQQIDQALQAQLTSHHSPSESNLKDTGADLLPGKN
jgi:hypothetical protein